MQALRVVFDTLVWRAGVFVHHVIHLQPKAMCGAEREMTPAPSEVLSHSQQLRHERPRQNEWAVGVVARATDKLTAQMIDDTFGVALHGWVRLEALRRSRRERHAEVASVTMFCGALDERAKTAFEEERLVRLCIEDERRVVPRGEIHAGRDLRD